eukprot:3940624-Rhodomonas_salina.5
MLISGSLRRLYKVRSSHTTSSSIRPIDTRTCCTTRPTVSTRLGPPVPPYATHSTQYRYRPVACQYRTSRSKRVGSYHALDYDIAPQLIPFLIAPYAPSVPGISQQARRQITGTGTARQYRTLRSKRVGRYRTRKKHQANTVCQYRTLRSKRIGGYGTDQD